MPVSEKCTKRRVLQRLRIIAGQVNALQRMTEQEQPYTKTFRRSLAIQEALAIQKESVVTSHFKAVGGSKVVYDLVGAYQHTQTK